jgi:hypothetical protein
MIIDMETTQGEKLYPQVYFTDTSGKGYSEINSRKAYKTDKGQYYFKLPPLEKIVYMRFDPDMRKKKIMIRKITFIQDYWFKRDYYHIPLNALSPASQITDFQRSKQGISFQTTGRDPQMNIRFQPEHTDRYTTEHLDLLLISFLVYLVLMYLCHLYKTEEVHNTLSAKLILYTLFFSFMIFKVIYYKDHVRFSYPPDELAHLSYITHVHQQHDFVPDYQKMVMINNKHAGNYLSHPPLYYEIMNFVYDPHLSAKGNVDNFRSFSILIYILSFILILYLGFSARLGILGDFVFLTLLTSVPMHAYIGASISNDTLAMLGAAIFILGLKKLLENSGTTPVYLLIVSGALIAYFSKLTAAILIFFAVLFFLVYMVVSRNWIKITKRQWGIFLAAMIPILYYQFSIVLEYHALVPTFNVTHPQQYLASPFFVPEAFRQHLNHMEWFKRMLHYIEGGWFGIHSHHSFVKPDIVGYLGLLILHLLAIVSLFLPCKEAQKNYCLIGKFTLLALFGVLIVQYFFSYKAHLHSGYMGGLQPRYLLPFMFSFAIMASIFVERFRKIFIFNIFIILICIHALYSDFFYFLQYYQ